MVTIALDAAQQSEVKAGDTVTVTLPDGHDHAGRGLLGGHGGDHVRAAARRRSRCTVTLTDPGAAGTLDQAPVTVNITTGTVPNVLAVPVTALLARSPGGYVVEVIGAGNTRRWCR